MPMRGWARSLAGRISPARKAAFDLLLELRRKPDLHSDHLLRSKPVEALSDLDRNLATTLVMGVLRWQLVLQQRIRDALTKSKGHLADPVQVSLEIGALQLLLLDRIPARAAIFESVELVRQSGNEYAAGLVNAVLRKLAQTPKLNETDAVAAHPQWMVDRWVKAFGLDTAAAICRYDQLPPTSEEPGVFVVRARQRVQDEGSQLIAELAGRGTEILDCCAAPGGKTAILAERNPTASITACDISPTRLKAMQSLLGRPPNIHFRVLDATELPFQNQFDLVLCDAPCSGTGTLARNPEIKHRVTTNDFQRHHDRQLRLLRSAMRTLREGGRLIYSTCSLEAEESDSVVDEILQQEKNFQLKPWKEQIRTLENEGTLHPGTADRLFPNNAPDRYLRTFPGLYPGDGFFAACFIRK
jgi:16S rRNA (cytosine967-C5)-methyltransferase